MESDSHNCSENSRKLLARLEGTVLRHAKEKHQARIAEALGRSESHISRVLSNQESTTAKELLEILVVLKLDIVPFNPNDELVDRGEYRAFLRLADERIKQIIR